MRQDAVRDARRKLNAALLVANKTGNRDKAAKIGQAIRLLAASPATDIERARRAGNIASVLSTLRGNEMTTLVKTFADATNHAALDEALKALSGGNPELLSNHHWTRVGGHPADHTFRGRLADLLQDHGRDQEADLLRSPMQHVMVDAHGRVQPARYTHERVQAAFDKAGEHFPHTAFGLLHPIHKEFGIEPHENPREANDGYYAVVSTPQYGGLDESVHASELGPRLAFLYRDIAEHYHRVTGGQGAPALPEEDLHALRDAPFETEDVGHPAYRPHAAAPASPDDIDHNATSGKSSHNF